MMSTCTPDPHWRLAPRTLLKGRSWSAGSSRPLLARVG